MAAAGCACAESFNSAAPWRAPVGWTCSCRDAEVEGDLCSSEAGFYKIKTIRATALPWEGPLRPATV